MNLYIGNVEGDIGIYKELKSLHLIGRYSERDGGLGFLHHKKGEIVYLIFKVLKH